MSDNTQPPEKFKGLGLSEVESLNLSLDYLDTHYGVRSLFLIRRGAKFPLGKKHLRLTSLNLSLTH